MENATEALHIAASVLIFVVALTISINAFSNVRAASQSILDMRDREYDYSYVESNGGTERYVNKETIIPSIYKAYRENYKIVFKFTNDSDYLYEKRTNTGETNKICSIDLSKEVLGDDTNKEEFIKAVLYGNQTSNWNEIYQKFTKMGIYLNEKGLYGIIKEDMRFKEELGIYYEEELKENYDLENSNSNNNPKKRVITYTQENV